MTEATDTQDKPEALGDQEQCATRAGGVKTSSKDRDHAKKDETKAKDAPRDKDNLDEGLEESMDGSDPPSSLQP